MLLVSAFFVHAPLVLVAAPGDAGKVRRLLYPPRPLVSETHGLIVVHGDNNVTIVGRQFEPVEVAAAVPESGADYGCCGWDLSCESGPGLP
jgi:hypothetical protein